MKIAVIGAGNVGSVLGRRLAGAGEEVTFAVRDPKSEKVQSFLKSIGKNISSTTVAEACAAADVIVLATPYSAAQDAMQSVGKLNGKILIDCTNPLTEDMKGLTVGLTTSAAENVASWAKGARVVKCFNMTGAQIMSNPTFGSDHATMFMSGDDPEAKKVVGGEAGI